MYPGSYVNGWHDESAIQQTTPAVVDNKALFLTASSFDKGPEKLTRTSGDEFYELFGTDIQFNKHGQPGIQAAAIIDAGGELLVQRIVAKDATLPNIVFVANLSTETVQKKNSEGDPLYIDNENGGVETTTPTDTIAVESTNTVIKWAPVSIENCKSFEQVKEEAAKLYDPDNGVYPLIVVTDNGRGDTKKSVRISPNNEISISMGKEFYTINIYEGTTRVDSGVATLDSTIYRNRNYAFNEQTSTQVHMYIDEDVYDAYVVKLAEDLKIDAATVRNYNLINGTTIKGIAVEGLTIDPDSVDLDASYGITLVSGSNGEFGNSPANTKAWEESLIDFYKGKVTNEIYDLDEFKIGAVVDACYPYPVKEAIAELVTFRGDCVFFRDMMLDVSNYSDALLCKGKFTTNNKFVADYLTYYQIYDPSTKRKIRVTMMYDFAACLVRAFDAGIQNPTAGIANGFILENAIEGTVNYVPRIIPEVNQKQLLDDLRVNYAIFHEGQCIVQSLYTSQEAYTQLSYVNNVLAIQNVIRSIRTSCPKKRYTFIENGDFTDYAEAVNNVLKGFKSDFDILKFEYTKNMLESNQKIFHASIRFAFKDWAQTELFDIFAISNQSLEATME